MLNLHEVSARAHRSWEELEAEGFADRQVLRKLKEQVRSSYASAPPEFIAEAREAGLACGEAAGQLGSSTGMKVLLPWAS